MLKICSAGGRPKPKIKWFPQILENNTSNSTKYGNIQISKSIIEKSLNFDETLFGCQLDDTGKEWITDFLAGSGKNNAQLYLNRPKWPRSAPRVPDYFKNTYSTSIQIKTGNENFKVENIPDKLSNLTIMVYDKFDAINPSPILVKKLGVPFFIHNMARFTVSNDKISNAIAVNVDQCSQIGDYYFRQG